jgi:hypothetical protein
MLMSRTALASREGSLTAAPSGAAARERSVEAAARALAGIRAGQLHGEHAAAVRQGAMPQPLPEDRLAFLSAVLQNPTIGAKPPQPALTPDAAMVAITALDMAAGPQPLSQPSPPPPPQPPKPQPAPNTNANAARPLPMSPYYNQHSQVQQSAVAAALPFITRAAAEHVRFSADAAPSSSSSSSSSSLPSVVRVAEIGCAAASNTKLPVQALLAGLARRAHRTRRQAAGSRQALARQQLLRQKRARASGSGGGGALLGGSAPRTTTPVFLSAAAENDDDDDEDAAAAFPLPAQVELRLVDLPANDWAQVTRTAQQLSDELRGGGGGGGLNAAADDEDAALEDEDALDDDEAEYSEPVDAAFDDDALAAGGPRPPAAPDAEVFTLCNPASMYDPRGVAPRASLHLIYSNTCASWQPAQHATAPAGSAASAFVSLSKAQMALASDPRRRERDGGALQRCLEGWRAGARRAMREWLRLRGEELADGGVLVLNVPCADDGDGGDGGREEDDEEADANSFHTWMAPLVGGAVRDLLREGAITSDEAEALTVPVCALHTDDLLDVLLREVGAVDCRRGGDERQREAQPAPVFELLECSREVLPPHPAWYGYRTGAMSPRELGKSYAEWVAAVSEPFLVAALAPKLAARGVVRPRTDAAAANEAAAAVVARLFDHVAERVARDPRPLRYLPVVLTLRRVPRKEEEEQQTATTPSGTGGFVAAR